MCRGFENVSCVSLFCIVSRTVWCQCCHWECYVAWPGIHRSTRFEHQPPATSHLPACLFLQERADRIKELKERGRNFGDPWIYTMWRWWRAGSTTQLSLIYVFCAGEEQITQLKKRHTQMSQPRTRMTWQFVPDGDFFATSCEHSCTSACLFVIVVPHGPRFIKSHGGQIWANYNFLGQSLSRTNQKSFIDPLHTEVVHSIQCICFGAWETSKSWRDFLVLPAWLPWELVERCWKMQRNVSPCEAAS